MEYPAYVFKTGQPPKLVQDIDQHRALGPGWLDAPELTADELAEQQRLAGFVAHIPAPEPVYHDPFPAYYFAHGKAPLLIASAEQANQLGDEWFDNPADADAFAAALKADIAALDVGDIDEPGKSDDVVTHDIAAIVDEPQAPAPKSPRKPRTKPADAE